MNLNTRFYRATLTWRIAKLQNCVLLEIMVGSLREKLTEMKSRSASLLGRKVEEGRRKSSNLHSTMASLIKGEEATDGEELIMTLLIAGSELVIAGGIPRKVGNKRFIYFGNPNEYYDLVQLSLTESGMEENSEDADEKNKNGHSMDTSVRRC